jgi:hypothetical protein
MSEQVSNGRRVTTMGASVVILGLAQPALVALALARVLDPGSTTFEIIGVLAGLGMAAGALACALYVPSHHRAFTTTGALGVVAGLATAGVWLSWLGTDINTGDLARVGVLLGSDVLFTVWLVAAALLMDRSWALAGFYELTLLMSVRAVAEIWLLALLFTASGGPGSQNLPMLFVAFAVLLGWLVLAVWEIAFGTRLIRRGLRSEQPHHSAAV